MGRFFSLKRLFSANNALVALLLSTRRVSLKEHAASIVIPRYVNSVTFSNGIPLMKNSFLYLLFLLLKVIHFDFDVLIESFHWLQYSESVFRQFWRPE